MPPLGPIKRADLVRHLRELGFDGPHLGSKHSYMVKGSLRLRIPNPHRSDISPGLLRRLLNQAGISREEWERL